MRLNPAGTPLLHTERIERLGLDPARRAGKPPGGQRARLALTLGLAKRPELLILDEPVASLDPLARREFPRGLMEATRLVSAFAHGEVTASLCMSRARISTADLPGTLAAAALPLVGR